MCKRMWLYIAAIYIVIAITMVRFTKARQVIQASFDEVDFDLVPYWKKATYFMMVHSASILLWPLFISSWLNQNNTANLEEKESMWPFSKKTNKTMLNDVVEESRQLPSNEKLLIAKKIVGKITDLNAIHEAIDEESLAQMNDQTIYADKEYISNNEYLTPGDLAMMYLYQASEYAKTTGNMPLHIRVVGAMTSLLDVVPEGSMSLNIQMLQLKATS